MKNKAIVHFTYSQDLCRKCFLRLIEARVRKYSRLSKLFRRDDHILTIDPLTHFLVKRIVAELPLEIYYKNMKITDLETTTAKKYIGNNNINKIIIPWTIDDECSLFLEKLFAGKRAISQKYYSLLLTMTDEEALLFARFNNLRFVSLQKNRDFLGIVNAMQEKYPETKFSLMKSIKEMHTILKRDK